MTNCSILRWPAWRLASCSALALSAATLGAGPVAGPSRGGGQDAVPANTTDTIVDRITLEPLDQRVSDINVLGTSLRITDAGLAQPNDFAQVFRLPGDDGMMMRAQGGLYAVFPQSTYGTWEVRKTKERFHLPVIGQGTTFYIGAESLRAAYGDGQREEPASSARRAIPMMIMRMPLDRRISGLSVDDRSAERPALHAPSAGKHAGANHASVQRSMDESSHGQSHGSGQTSGDVAARVEVQLPPIAGDADYRRARIAELLARASGAK